MFHNGLSEVWKMSGYKNLCFVFDRMPDQDGCTFIECETEEGASINAGEWRDRPDGLVELVVPVNYAAQSELAALREELAQWKHMVGAVGATIPLSETLASMTTKQTMVDYFKGLHSERDGLRKSLTAAEQRNAELAKANITIEVIVEKTVVHGQKRVNGVIVASASGAVLRGESALEVRENIIRILDSARYEQSIFAAALKPTESGASE